MNVLDTLVGTGITVVQAVLIALALLQGIVFTAIVLAVLSTLINM